MVTTNAYASPRHRETARDCHLSTFELQQSRRMKIGIIGAGNMGTALARMLVALGHEVALAISCGPATMRHLAE